MVKNSGIKLCHWYDLEVRNEDDEAVKEESISWVLNIEKGQVDDDLDNMDHSPKVLDRRGTNE